MNASKRFRRRSYSDHNLACNAGGEEIDKVLAIVAQIATFLFFTSILLFSIGTILPSSFLQIATKPAPEFMLAILSAIKGGTNKEWVQVSGILIFQMK